MQRMVIILEMNSYLRTTDNEDKIIDLFLNVNPGPYLIFLNKYKELSEMINTFGNLKSNESIEILRLFDYKLSKHSDKRLLRELIENGVIPKLIEKSLETTYTNLSLTIYAKLS